MTKHPQRFIGICGRAGSGKDTVAKALAPTFARVAFADCLRDSVRAITGWSAEQLEDRDFKEKIDPFWGFSPRWFLQRFGTEVGRVIHPDVWVKAWERKVQFYQNDIVTTDVRFPNEVDVIRRYGGKMVRVRRLVSEAVPITHESEEHAMRFDVDLELMNVGTMDELEDMARGLPKTLWGM